MIGEAIRQVTGIELGFTLRNISATTALVVQENKPVEIITTFHHRKSAGTSESQWWDFTIASHNGHSWVKHFSGKAAPLDEPLSSAKGVPDLPREVDVSKWFDVVSKAGFHYGPEFRCLSDLKCSTSQPGAATATIANDPLGEESDYHIHPTAVDNAFQMVPFASLLGLSRDVGINIITSIREISIIRCPTALTANVLGYPNGDGSISGSVDLIADGQTMMSMKGATISVLRNSNERDTHGGARYFLTPHIDLLNLTDLLRSGRDHGQYASVLDEMVEMALLYSRQVISEFEPEPVHLQNYKTWINSQADFAQKSPLGQLDKTTLIETINEKAKELSDTPAVDVALAIQKVTAAASNILSGSSDAMDILSQEDLLSKLTALINEFDNSSFIRTLAQTTPNLRILELGAGSGYSTDKYLDNLQSFYSKYTVTDASNNLIAEVKERYKGKPNMEFAALDINKDLELYDFAEGREYDLIIATNVLHQGDSIPESLKRIRSLLHPRGRLLLHETKPACKWIKFIFGVLPSWWRAAANNPMGEPYLDAQLWEAQLKDAGFGAIDTVTPKPEEPLHLNVIISRPEAGTITSKEVAILSADNIGDVSAITRQLTARGYTVSRITLGDEVPVGRDIIALLDKDSPFLQDMTPDAFDHLRELLVGLEGSGLFWITHSSVMNVTNPHYAASIGLARNLRTELDIDFATCQTETDFADDKVLDSFEHFHQRRNGDAMAPEMEYVIDGGKVNIGRFHHIAVADEQLTIEANDVARLAIDAPGRLTNLKWTSYPSRAPIGREVEIEVFAAGLNDKVCQYH